MLPDTVAPVLCIRQSSRMHATRISFLFAASVALLLAACNGNGPTAPIDPVDPPVDTVPPPIEREMRGVWVATVANIDWPSRSTLTADQQRAELVDILDRAVATGLNAVIFHVRPAGDALYRSTLEPWGAMLTGTQGGDPGYDPLAFAVEQAHARGLELHAWINPFRAGNTRDTLLLAPTHAFNTQRDKLVIYGTQVWFDPGEPAVHDHAIRVVRDIVSRYDIDAIHADDYFYPYQQFVGGTLVPFPDSGSHARSGSTMTRDDWRRDNVNRFVERMYREVHEVDPTVDVGISPFGIWRPGSPPGVVGLDAYATIYADSRKWLQEGWVDYLAPQLYWAIGSSGQSFPALLDWWFSQNTRGRHVWPGLATYKVSDGTSSAFSTSEIPAQIELTRDRTQGTGHIHYNTTTTLKRSGGAVAASIEPLYERPALVPGSPWLDAVAPPTPTIVVSGQTLTIAPAAGEPARWWVVRARPANGTDPWMTRIVFAGRSSYPLGAVMGRVIVNAVDAAGNVSMPAEWRAIVAD